jgi:hypothetical protein
MWAQAVACAIGLWITAAPDLLGSGRAAEVNEQIVGPLAASFACVAMWQVARSLRWVNVVFGAWLVASPAVLGCSGSEAAHSILAGIALLGFSSVRGRLTHRYDGGWRMLFAKRHGQPE